MIKRLTSWGLLAMASLAQAGCAVVGFSTGGGWFFWPGGWIGVLVIAILAGLFFFWNQIVP